MKCIIGENGADVMIGSPISQVSIKINKENGYSSAKPTIDAFQLDAGSTGGLSAQNDQGVK